MKSVMVAIEEISETNLEDLTKLMIRLWPDCDYENELICNREILKSEGQTCYLALIRGQYVGFIQLSRRMEYVEGSVGGPTGYIEGIYVEKSYRNTGVGRHLVELGAKWALENGCKGYASDAELGNEESIQFHRSVGFKEVNRSVNFYRKFQ